MNINLNTKDIDWNFEIASKYLPVRLSTTFFDGIGECIAIVANRQILTDFGHNCQSSSFDIVEGSGSEVFVTTMNQQLYETIKHCVLNMESWYPENHYNTFDGKVDGTFRKIHLDSSII